MVEWEVRLGVIKINTKSKFILIAIFIALAGLATISVARVYAGDFQGRSRTIIQKLVQKFNLKESDVQAVFDEVRREHQNQMQANLEERLTQAVKDGKITEAQKQLILAKHKELQDKREKDFANWQNLTPEQKREKMQTQKDELEAWAKQNGIDLQYFFGFGKFKGMGMRGRWHSE